MILRIAIFVTLLSLAIDAQKQLQTFDEQEQWREFEEFLEWKKSKRIGEDRSYEKKHKKQYYENRNTDKVYERNEQLPNSNPPPIDQAALMARYIVNQAGKKNISIVILILQLKSSLALSFYAYQKLLNDLKL